MKTNEHHDFEISLRRFRDDLRTSPELRARMRAEPAGVLEEQGVDLPPETEVRVVDDTAEVRHFVLPHAPTASLSDAAMDAVSGGTSGKVPVGYAVTRASQRFLSAQVLLGNL